MANDITTIKLSRATKERIDKLKVYKRESYDEVIQKMLEILSLARIESEKARAYIDLAIDTQAIYIDSSPIFPLQFVIPSSLLDFTLPNEKSFSILIDKFGLEGTN